MSALGAAEAHRQHTKLLLREALQIELARSPAAKHLGKAIRLKIEQEDRWREGLTSVSNHWEDILTKHDLDTAIIYAQSEWRLLVPDVTKAATPPSSPNADEVKQRLTSALSGPLAVQGAMQMYLGLAGETARVSGQQALEHMGLNKTFAFAHPQNMARDLFQVRGSKVIQGMYGSHVDSLSKLIVKATDPRHPMTINEVKASINEQWPGMRAYQVDRIARTETATVWTNTSVNAYAANGISEFNSAIAEGPTVGIESEEPCDECVDAAAEGPFPIDSGDLPPWHPNCRCEAIPVLEDSATGDQWLPPDEPWTGGAEGADLPVEEAPLNSIGGVDESWSPDGTIQPAPEPIPTVQQFTSADYEKVQEMRTYGINSDPELASTKQIKEAFDQFRENPEEFKLNVIQDADGEVRAAQSYRASSLVEGGPSEYLAGHIGSNIKGGGTELLRITAREALTANRALVLEALPDAVPFYEKLGFTKWHDPLMRDGRIVSQDMRLEGDALDRLAAKSGDAGSAVAAPPTVPKELPTDPKERLKALFSRKLHLPKGKITPEVYTHIVDLAKLPDDILKRLARKKVHVWMGDTSVPGLDEMGWIRNVQPRGWTPGKTWDQVYGAYSPEKRYVLLGTGEGGSTSVALHETGHAIEGQLFRVADRRELVKWQKTFYNNLRPYYQQGGAGGLAGAEELWAESVAVYFKSGEASLRYFVDARSPNGANANAYVKWFEKKMGIGEAPPAPVVPVVPVEDPAVAWEAGYEARLANFQRAYKAMPGTTLDSVVQSSLEQIAKVHDMPVDIGSIPVDAMPYIEGKATGRAFYERAIIGGPDSTQMGVRSTQIKIAMGPGVERSRMLHTLNHELGHTLDYGPLSPGLSDGWSSLPSGAMRDFLKVVRESDTVRRDIPNSVYASQYKSYLVRPQELWARAYSQFIATETQDAELLRGMQLATDSKSFQTWPADQFKPIGEAVRAALKERGLIGGATETGTTAVDSTIAYAARAREITNSAGIDIVEPAHGKYATMKWRDHTIGKVFQTKAQAQTGAIRLEIPEQHFLRVHTEDKALWKEGVKGYYNFTVSTEADATKAKEMLSQITGTTKSVSRLPDHRLTDPARSQQSPAHPGLGPQALRAQELLRRARPAVHWSTQTSKSSVSPKQTRGRIGSVQVERVAKLRRKARA